MGGVQKQSGAWFARVKIGLILSIAKKLRHCEILASFDDALLTQLASCGTVLRYQAGEEIFGQGSMAESLYVIVKGAVRLQRDTQLGPFTLATMNRGDLFDERFLLQSEERTLGAVAETRVELVALDLTRLRAAAETRPSFDMALSWALWKGLSLKLRISNQKLAEFFASDDDASRDKEPTEKKSPRQGGFRIDMAAKRDLFDEQRLTPMEINFLASLSREESYGPNEAIFHEGAVGEAMYVVLDGTVLISKFIPGGGDEGLAFLGRGEYFGEMGVMDHAPRSASARAHTSGAVVLAIARNVAEGILAVQKASSTRLLNLLCNMASRRLLESDDKLVGWFLLSAGHTG
jgi:CRP/FNR family cyclic AMP-dependent transcriptional regulator